MVYISTKITLPCLFVLNELQPPCVSCGLWLGSEVGQRYLLMECLIFQYTGLIGCVHHNSHQSEIFKTTTSALA